MSASPVQSADAPQRRVVEYRLAVSNYDRTASLLIALLIIIGLTVGGLLVVFAAHRFRSVSVAIPVIPVEATSPHDAALGLKRDLEPPGLETSEAVAEPSLEDTLSALTAIAAKEVLLREEDVDSAEESSRGQGFGDSRRRGDAQEGVVERVPRWVRWRIRFQPVSLDEYAGWLDYHRIELAVLGRDNRVHYATLLARSRPQIRVGNPATESRGYTNALDGPFVALNRQLAEKAGIEQSGQPVLLFYPFDVEAVLYDLERTASGGRDANEIRRTVFTVKRQGSDYVFEVVDQQFF